MTVHEAFKILDGVPAKGLKGNFVFHIAGKDPATFLLSAASNQCRVTDLSAAPDDKMEHKPVAVIRYRTPEVFFADARGELPMTAYFNGTVGISGNVKEAEKLEAVFEPLAIELKSRTADSPDLDEPFNADALGLIGDPGAAVPWYAVHTKAWWRRHFGTDLLLGNWLTLVGTLLWFFSAFVPVAARGGHGSAYEWATIASAFLFVLGFCFLAEVSYPEKLGALLESISRAPNKAPMAGSRDAGSGDLERGGEANRGGGISARVFGTNPMSRGMAIMNAGLLPFLVWAAIEFARVGATSTIGWGVTGGVLLFAPALVFMTESMTDESLRDMARGGDGSTIFYELAQRWRCLGACCCVCLCCRVDSDAFKRHLGNDAKVGLWYFVVIMAISQVLCTAALAMDPWSGDAQLNFWMCTFFTVGLALNARAQYPEHMNSSILFGSEAESA